MNKEHRSSLPQNEALETSDSKFESDKVETRLVWSDDDGGGFQDEGVDGKKEKISQVSFVLAKYICTPYSK